jgi:hypothetical protein
MDSENTVAEGENMLDAGDEMVLAEANENEVPMLAPMREMPDDEHVDVDAQVYVRWRQMDYWLLIKA